MDINNLVKYCQIKECEKVEYVKLSTAGNNPKITKAALYSQYVNNMKGGTILKLTGAQLKEKYPEIAGGIISQSLGIKPNPQYEVFHQKIDSNGSLNGLVNMASIIDYGKLSVSTNATNTQNTTLSYRQGTSRRRLQFI